MFPLQEQEIPADAMALEAAVTDSLRKVFTLPRNRKAVVIEGNRYPALDAVRIDLAGATIKIDQPPPKPKPVGKPKPGPSAKRFVLLGHPIHYHDATLDLELTAANVQFEYAADRKGALILMLKQAEDGRIEVRIGRDDLERLLLEAAKTAADAHGVTIQDVRIALEQETKDTIAAQVQVTAKKFLSAVIDISGQLKIDQELNARLSMLTCEGQGMVGNLVCGFVRPQLQRIEGKRFSLMALSLGEVRLRDLDIAVDQKTLHISAAFGSL